MLLARARSFLRNLFRRDRVEQDLDDEVRAALDLLIADELEKGKSPEEARRAAHVQLGGVESVKEHVRDARAGAFLDTVLGDIRYAARLLIRNPIFTLTAAMSLARIGSGAVALGPSRWMPALSIISGMEVVMCQATRPSVRSLGAIAWTREASVSVRRSRSVFSLSNAHDRSKCLSFVNMKNPPPGGGG